MKTQCLARREGDEMQCHACMLWWNRDDAKPPKCKPIKIKKGKKR